MNAIAQLQPSRLPLAPALAKEYDLTSGQWRVLVEQTFPNAQSVESVMMAMAYCKQRNLDIFKKPVHIVPMWSSALRKMVETVWPGIAEIRTTATRTGEYAGIDAVEFGPMIERDFTGQVKQGNSWETITKSVRYPEWASVVVYRMVKGQKSAFHAKVFWEEAYASTGKSDLPNDMWARRPRGQLDKCVEAAALRKAFPEELGNVYAAEEMEGRTIDGMTIDHVEVKVKTPPAPPPPPGQEHASKTVDAEIVTEDGEVIENDAQEQFDAAEFFEGLEADLMTAADIESLEDAWTARDPMSVFDGDDVNQGIAMAIRKRAEKRLGGAV